jgi:UDP-N-acetylmuramyl pentapeptide phosphotransferase/UDP-N-acetylglucosamine-1-phosphate transferase
LLLGAGALVATAVAAFGGVDASAWVLLTACLLVLAAGLVDDVVSIGPRGLRSHLRALAAGHLTTGILKLTVIVGASIVAVAQTHPSALWEAASGVVLLAGAANVWNGLDVRPGRALKAYLPCALPFLLAGEPAAAPALVGVLVTGLAALPLDLREVAMLGDGGSNLLGFAVGLGSVLVLPDWAALAAAVAVVGLNVVADTIGFSRVIDAAPPLRWIDRLGRG